MRNRYYFILLFLLCFPFIVKAATLEMTDYEVTIRKGPGTNYSSVGKTGPTGDTYTLKTTELFQSEQGCNSGYWYKIDYNNSDAYICSTYGVIKTDTPIVITDEARTQCEAELKNAGFPEPYWNSLCTLKAQHPNWVFEAIYTGYDFAAAVQAETCKCSISTSSRAEYQDSSCGKKYDPGYTGASQVALAHYMNPLNFLDEKNIFMFESNYTNPAVQPYYAEISKKIIPSSTYFVGFIPNIYTYIANASVSGVSPSFISARMKQELGQGDLGYVAPNDNNRLFSKLSGNYSTRYPGTVATLGNLNNYYNFYSIAAYDGTNVTQKELIYARNHGWGGTGNQDADRQAAVTGGAQWIYNAYTNVGQETVYFNKFNVNPKSTSTKFQHQYMTNVSAPVSEASLLYKGYSNAGALGQPLIFHIPVYGNLNAQINNTPGGANGDTSNGSTELSPSTMVISSGYQLNGTVITNVKGNTSISDFSGRIISQGGSVEIYSGSSRILEGIIGTGMTVKITSSTGSTEFTVVVKGDSSGDGIVNALDLLQVKKYLLKQKELPGAYYSAADVSGDGTINALDLLQIKKSLLGQKEL